LYRPESDQVFFPLAFEHGQRVQWRMRQAGQGLTEHVIRTREPLLIEEDVTARLEELGVVSIGQDALSWLGVPMTRGNQVFGVIAAQSYTTPRLYNKRHQDLLSAVANQAVIAIENARLFEQTRARAEHERLIGEVTAHMRETLDVHAVLQTATREIGKALALHDMTIQLQEMDSEG
jgi:GAF domain-containing protein